MANTFAENFHWDSLGKAIGNGINGALGGLDWNLIQETVRNIATGITDTLNSFIQTTDWALVGQSFGNGINTILDFFHTAINNFDWTGAGTALADFVNNAVNTIDFVNLGQTISDGIKGVFDFGIAAIEGIDWWTIGEKVRDGLAAIDWNGIADGFFELIGAAFGGLSAFFGGLLSDAVSGAQKYFQKKIEECGGNVVKGIFKGIKDAVVGIAEWIKDHIFTPFMKGFTAAFGIHSPSTVRNIHTLQTNVVTDVNVDMDDVVITCVRIVTEDENSNQVTFQSGSDGYAVVIDSNKFINKDNAAEIASMVGGRVVGLRFRPMTVSSLQDPTIEAGDGAIVYDRKLKSYKTFFTNVVFSIDADNQMSNDAESALRNSAERFSEASKIYQNLKKHLNKNKTEWEKAMEELEKAMKEQVGLYPVIKTLDDGSKVYYMCDHQTLEESQVVFELNGKGWAVSTDGGRTWNAGLLVDGTMITKILNSIGINADWINTGAFTVLDSDGNIMFKADTARQTKEAAHIADTRATESESWAHGHKLYPERDKDNAKYYADQAKQVATKNGFCHMEIREDGHLYLSRTENIVQSLDFKINDKGRLGVMMS